MFIYYRWYKNVKKKFGSWKMLKCLWRQVWCVPSIGIPFFVHKEHMDQSLPCIVSHYQWQYHFFDININEWIQGSSKNMPATKNNSFASMYIKLIVPNRFILYDLWNFAWTQVQKCFPSHLNSCRERGSPVTTEITLWSSLQIVKSSLIAESTLVMAG